MRTLIILLGSSASGKSTLTRTLCGEGGIEALESFEINGVEEKTKYVIFPNGSAIVGNAKNGSDSISNMEARAALIKWLLEYPGVDFVITDAVRSSKKWDVDWVQNTFGESIAVVYVYMFISLEENLRRLKTRRASNGKTIELSEKTLANVTAFRDRAKKVWEAAQKDYDQGPVSFVCLDGTLSPRASVDQVRAACRLLLATCATPKSPAECPIPSVEPAVAVNGDQTSVQ